jgi:YebC/PmpR family DNA-binding regulatory protein
MSGHSKWAKIKRQKGVKDIKKGAIFTKIAKNITLAANEAGGDVDTNFALRLAVEKAKAANMPSDNIARAIKKGTGEGQKLSIQRISYEANFSGGVAFLIDTQTDNTNRTVSTVRSIVESSGGKMVPAGSVSWQFQERGLINVIPAKLKKAEKFGAADTYEAVPEDEVELAILDIEGVLDIEDGVSVDENDTEIKIFHVLTERTDFAKILKQIEELQYQVESAELVKIAKDKVNGTPELEQKVENLINNLEDSDDVDAVWSNLGSVA